MFKVKFNSKQFAAIEANFKKDIKDILSQPAVMREVGAFMVERLKFQTRTEKPFNENGALPLLKPATVKHRKYLEKYNKTHETFEVERSNLTVIGAFLDSLTYIVKGPGLLEMVFSGNHPRYKGKSGAIGKVVANSDLAKWLAKKGFSVFDKSIKDNKTVKSRIRTIALRYVRRGLKVRNKLS